MNTGEFITPHSVFHVASLSKNFTATVIMKLVEDGKLNPDDKLFGILPYNRMHAPSSTMQSSISDMMNRVKFNIQNGVFKNHLFVIQILLDV